MYDHLYVQTSLDIDLALHRRYRGLQPDEALIKGHLEKIDSKLDVYEQILSKQKYIAGDVSSKLFKELIQRIKHLH